jgi:hypothetical protein
MHVSDTPWAPPKDLHQVLRNGGQCSSQPVARTASDGVQHVPQRFVIRKRTR